MRVREPAHVLVGRQRMRRPGNGNAGKALTCSRLEHMAQRLRIRGIVSTAHQHTETALAVRAPLPQRAYALEHGRDAFCSSKRQNMRPGHDHG